jgi:hypothetical protein
MITGQALASLGEDIGKAVTKYQVDKQNAEDRKLRYEAILPFTTGQFGAEEGEKMAKSFAKDPNTAALIMNYAGIERERNIVNQAVGVSTEAGTGKVNKQDFMQAYTELGGQNLAGTLRLIDEMSGPGEIKISPEGIISQDGLFKGQIPRQVTERVPTKVLEQQNFLEQYEKAQDLFRQGKTREAQNITTSLGMIDKITGQPIPASELFEGAEPIPDKKPADPAPTPDPLNLGL